jgi:hypothetical protein
MGSRVAPFRDPVTLAVGAFAVHRLTRLVVGDEITAPLRERISNAAPEGRLAYLLTCPWCVSVWAGAGWALLTCAAPSTAAAAGAVLAWSSATGLLASAE